MPNIPGGDFVALEEGGGSDQTIDSRQGYAFFSIKGSPFSAFGGNLPGDGLNQAGPDKIIRYLPLFFFHAGIKFIDGQHAQIGTAQIPEGEEQIPGIRFSPQEVYGYISVDEYGDRDVRAERALMAFAD